MILIWSQSGYWTHNRQPVPTCDFSKHVSKPLESNNSLIREG